MADNKGMAKAKNNKNDEFYTQYEDIQREVNAYLEYNPDVFKDKTILLPCDDPEWSNFTKYFSLLSCKISVYSLRLNTFSDSSNSLFLLINFCLNNLLSFNNSN